MGDYASEKYLEAKKWVSKKITDGYSWDDVKTLCVSIDEAKNEFIQLRDDELILPEDMEFREWPEFIDEMKKGYSAISDPYGLSNGSAGTTLPIPTDPGSPWTQYKKYLLGQKDGKRRISDNAVTQIEKNSHWILNHILRDTRVTGPKKGLVMGSVQSGKTANMIGLATMAAHYDWNYIIILSGTIDNLRKQTRDRFMHDLLASGGVAWHILDKTGNPNYMVDVQNIAITEFFLQSLGDAVQSEAVSSAFVWYDIDFSILEKEFFGAEKYHIYECSSLYADIPVFLEWMKMMNQEGKYLQWNVAIAGDKKATSKWSVGNIQVGKIERSKKTKQRDYIDIGSLRSGTDALSDIQISKLSADELKLYKETAKKRSSIIQNRGGLGVEDKPLLLLYRIDKNLGKETAAGRRTKINSNADIIGFSIIVAGEPSGGTHARSITVRLPE